MNNSKEKVKKICSFYVSEYHLVTMLLPYIKEKIEANSKIVILSEVNLRENIEMLLENINFASSDKQKILTLSWENTEIYKYRKVERKINEIAQKAEEVTILVSGKRDYIDIANKSIEMWIKMVDEKHNKINIVNCYEMMQFNSNIKDILDKHNKILNTSGEKEIGEVFEGYEKKDCVNIIND